ncbi:MAG: condensation domain-containing protein, partial [Bacteroidota bacterium]
ELGEIESVIKTFETVQQCVVTVHESSQQDKRIVAYLVTDKDFEQAALKLFIARHLPEYMIPNQWIYIDEVPLTRNGKVNRAALPNPEQSQLAKPDHEAAETPLELLLLPMWKELLGMDQIGINDNFFELGGHSLLAVRLLIVIQKELELEIGLDDIFAAPTIREMALYLENRQKGLTLPPLEVISRTQKIPLSFSQERLWFIDKLQGSTHYHIPAVFKVEGKLDKTALRYAFAEVVNRHEVLRTIFVEEEGTASQVVLPKNVWHLGEIDFNQFSSEEEWQSWLNHELTRPFDLAHDYMIRASLVERTAEEHILLFVIHHIASDGWSTSVLVNELTAFYGGFIKGAPSVLDDLHFQYADYSAWQRKYLSGDLLAERMDWWVQQLRGVQPLELPLDFRRPSIQSTQGRNYQFMIDQEVVDGIEKLVQPIGGTLYMGLLTVFKILLYRYSGQTDICVGSPVANRMHPDIEHLIGFFVNSLAFRSNLAGNPTVVELLQQVKKVALGAYAHQDIPFEQIVDRVVETRNLDRNPIFQVLFTLLNTPEVPAVEFDGIRMSPEQFESSSAKFDLTFVLIPGEHGLYANVEYAKGLFEESTIIDLTNRYLKLLAEVIKDANQSIDDLNLIDEEEAQHLIQQFNPPTKAYPEQKTIVELFKAQVVARKNAPAVSFAGKTLTYRELDDQSNQLATYLLRKGAEPGDFIAISMDRSIDLILGILSILKAGGIYVPIDMRHPDNRIDFILEDCQSTIILSRSTDRTSWDIREETELILLDEVWPEICKMPPSSFQIKRNSEDTAYNIYTSGTTGRPKGVLVSHRNVVSLIKGTDFVHFGVEDRILSTCSPSFDVSTLEYWGSLLNGGELVMCAEMTLLDAPALKQTIQRKSCTKMWFTTGWFNELVDTDLELFEPLNTVIVGGEKLSGYHIRKLRGAYPEMTIVNGYGPTENTTLSSSYTVGPVVGEDVPIGRALKNRTAYILNPKMKLCPVGTIGELWVGGSGVAQ